VLEDPGYEPEESMWRITVSPAEGAAAARIRELEYRRGDHGRGAPKLFRRRAVQSLRDPRGESHGVGRDDWSPRRYSSSTYSGRCGAFCGDTVMRHIDSSGS